MKTSASLLQRLRQPSDAAAWARFVELYTPLLYHWARRIGLQEADAADLVQEVLTVLYCTLPKFEYDPRQSFRAWLRTVTLNKWRERLRRRVAETFPDSQMLADIPADDPRIALDEADYRRHVVQQALQAMQGEFPVLTWKAFREHVMAERDAAEVAADLGLRIGSVYAAKSRVLSRLRQELDGLID